MSARTYRDISAVQQWFRERFPRQQHIYFGVSGATLLYEALRAQKQTSVVLPAFICATLSAAAVRARKRVMHIDADRRTQLPDIDELEAYLASQRACDTVLLVDHSFGYPFPELGRLRRRFPELLIIEDCARALGLQIKGELPGCYSDWVLFSMYKTVPASNNGAILLTRTPIDIHQGQRTSATMRERVASIEPLRFLYHELQRRTRPEFRSRTSNLGNCPEWEPAFGLPNRLCVARFARELKSVEAQATLRRSVANELTDKLCEAGIPCIQPAEGCESAGHFISFRTPNPNARNELLATLHRKGLFLQRTWDIVPAFYGLFAGTFPTGHCHSEHLANNMAHIRVRLYINRDRRNRLVEEIRLFFASIC